MKHAIGELEVALEEERAELVGARDWEVNLQVDIERAKGEVNDLIQKLADAAKETAKHVAKVADLEAAIAALKTARPKMEPISPVDATNMLMRCEQPATLAIAVATITGDCLDEAHPLDLRDVAACVRQLQAYPVCVRGAQLLAREKGKTWRGLEAVFPELCVALRERGALRPEFMTLANAMIKKYADAAPGPGGTGEPKEFSEFMGRPIDITSEVVTEALK